LHLQRVSQKVAIVTGAARGIGRAIGLRLGKEGAHVVVSTGSSTDAAQAVTDEIISNGGQATCIQCDVSDPGQVGRLVDDTLKQLERIDILVNNAGVTRDTLVARMKDDDWDQVLNVNLRGAFYCSRGVAKTMMRQRSGRIINISSVVGLFGNPGQANYSASKAGLLGLTKSLAKELAPRHVTVNAIAPGYIETEMTRELGEKATEEFMKYIPLRSIGSPEDVAALVIFLASEEARYITGEVIRVDGGLAM
jgi:3-oxoacyl-[acyl-carrier protein] reductase